MLVLKPKFHLLSIIHYGTAALFDELICKNQRSVITWHMPLEERQRGFNIHIRSFPRLHMVSIGQWHPVSADGQQKRRT